MNSESITHAGRALAALALFTLAVAHTPRVSAAEWTVVASGLHNPRGLDFAPNGALYIAESGSGGNGPVIPGAEFPMHFGNTGSITRVFKGTQERIVTGLPSFASETGTSATGPSALSFDGLGHAFVTFGLGRPPHYRDDIIALGAAAEKLGKLFQMTQNGQMKEVADLAGFEADADPDSRGADSNPNGVVTDGAGAAYVVDAGGNDLLRIDADGEITVVAVFPNRTVTTPPFLPKPPFPPQLSMQSVPTNVVRGPDGALYVSELTGFPFPVGGARIYRVVPGSAPTVYAQGFTNIIDLEFDAHGNLYVLEIDANSLLAPSPVGRLARVNAGGGVDTIASDGLIMPGGMAIGPDGAIYVSNYGTSPTAGQVVRIEP